MSVFLIEEDVIVDTKSLFQAILEVQIKALPSNLIAVFDSESFDTALEKLIPLGTDDRDVVIRRCLNMAKEFAHTSRIQIGALDVMSLVRSHCSETSKIYVFGEQLEYTKKVLENSNELEVVKWMLEKTTFVSLKEAPDFSADKENCRSIVAITHTDTGNKWASKNGARVCRHLSTGLKQPHISNFDWPSIQFKMLDVVENSFHAPLRHKVLPMKDICSRAERCLWSPKFIFDNHVELEGTIVRGFQRGSKQLGVPTANIVNPKILQGKALPLTGVFFGVGKVEGCEVELRYVASYGYNPYFGNEFTTFEPHFFHDFGEEELYGRLTQLKVFGYLRPQSPFANFDCLIRAIQLDCEIGMVETKKLTS